VNGKPRGTLPRLHRRGPIEGTQVIR